jgi:hypothetical protein
MGAGFLTQGRIVLRTDAKLLDALTARETLARAVEYNAAVIMSFWDALADGAAGFQQ